MTTDARPADGYAGDLTPRQAWDLLADDGGSVLVDVRTRPEWTFVGVPDVGPLGKEAGLVEWTSFATGGVNPHFLDQLTQLGLEPGDGRPVVFLCRSGARSISAARAATAAGLGPAYNVLEGFEGALDADGHRGSEGWRAAGLPWVQS
ncbi:MAG: rhodanese-like domain-containing protein [Actinomycetales bacterium]|nr:rhodanese-like domain-containing protein [Actinomycetales bacterium]